MRTIQEIYEEMLTTKGNYESLTTLNSTSATAIWRLMLYIFATALWIHEKLWLVFQKDIEIIIANAVTGTVQWYHKIALEFQLGDELVVFEDGRVGYETIDESKRVVKRCAVVEIDNTLVIKVAKENNSNVPEPLALDEIDAFIAYIKERKFAGTRVVTYNYPPDQLRVAMTIYYDPQVLLSNGKLISDYQTTPVIDAINDYVRNIKFGGKAVKSHVVDVVQQALGVCDVNMSSLRYKKYDDATWQSIEGNHYQSYSGYFTTPLIVLTYQPCNIK
jgi:hypothetical protein